MKKAVGEAVIRAEMPKATSSVWMRIPVEVPITTKSAGPRPCARARLIDSVMSGPGVSASSRLAAVNARRTGRLGRKSMAGSKGGLRSLHP